ncbi:MAG: VWA domain-containing protein [Deltaproteobacteria bacterium]|nr:VWA domain-containing protein [Deltaproteobacteria bacterium]
MKRTLALSLATMAVMAQSAAAHPGTTEVSLELLPSADMARLEATITNVGLRPLDQIKLIDDRGVTVRASSLREFKDGPESVAISIVVADSEIMMGNDGFLAADQPDSYFGYHAAITAGITAMDLSRTMPRGSRGMLITYDDKARTVVPMGPIEKLGAGALGVQKDYYSRVGTELVAGVRTGLDALSATRASHKVLIVIGDGNDTNNETARPQLAELRKLAAREHIHTHALIYKSQLSEAGNVITSLVPAAKTLSTHEAIIDAMKGIVARLGNRYTVTFPADELRWDGHSQDFTVQVGGDRLEPVTLYMIERDTGESCNLLGTWWKQVAIGFAAVALIALLMRLRAGRASL